MKIRGKLKRKKGRNYRRILCLTHMPTDNTAISFIGKYHLPSESKFSVLQGLNFRAVWRDSSPKFRNPVEKNCQGRRLPPKKIFGFLEIFAFKKLNSLFSIFINILQFIKHLFQLNLYENLLIFIE